MRLSLLLTIVGLLNLNASGLSQVFTITGKSITVKDVIENIEKKSGYKFLYQNELIENAQRIDIEVYDQPVEEVLKQALAQSNLGYRMFDDKLIVLTRANAQLIQTIKVTGKITGSVNGEPVPGATVLVKGTTFGTSSNENGVYSLDVPNANATLVISSVGYLSDEIQVGGRAVIDIQLVEDIQKLDEVVVIGYGTQKKSDLTGSVASVKAADIKNVSAQSLSEAIQGRVAGIYVTKGEGKPGSGSSIIIRGAASINGMDPLYIVDGVRMGTGNNFNLKDIETIEILKDAGSCAIYGAQSAAGVVLITTKRGSASEKMKIDFSANYGVRNSLKTYDLLGTQDYITAKKGAGWNYPSWNDPSKLPNTNWVDELFCTGKEQSYNLSLSGGSQKMTYFISGNYQREDGTRIDNWFQRYSLRINSDYKVNKRLKIGESIYAWKTGENPSEGGGTPFRSVPTMMVYDPTNVYGGWGKQPSEGYFEGSNLKAMELIHHRTNNSYAAEGNLFADLEIVKGLTFRTTVSASVGNENSAHFEEAWNFGSLAKPQATFEKNFKTWENYMANFVLTYARSFGKHDLKAMAGYEALKSMNTDLYGQTSDFPVAVAESFNLSTKSERQARGGNGNGRVLSQFSRLNYAYAGKYLLTASIRRDGSDKFGPENKWGVFPSVNLGWRISEEDFLKNNVPLVSNLKIRGGWGALGSDNLGQFFYEPAYQNLNLHTFDGTNRIAGWGVVKFPNKAIKWEEVRSTDIGLDLSLNQNKFNFSFDWYKRNTIDMIYQLRLPVSSGIGSHNSDPGRVPVNLGKIQNKGIEFTANYVNTFGDVKVNFGVNGSINENLVEKLSDDNIPILEGKPGDTWNSSIAKTESGEPMGQFWGFIAEGVFSSDAEVNALNAEAKQKAIAAGKATATSEVYYQQKQTGAGDLKYKDLNGDGKIDDKDKTHIGNPWPKFIYGFNANFEYKGFDFMIVFQGVSGNDIYNGAKAYSQNFYGDYNTTADVFGASNFNGNGITGQPRLGFVDNTSYVRDPNGNFKNPSSYYVENGAYLKLKTLQLGYRLPESVLSKIKISSARVYISGQNLLTFTKYSGLDPEISGDVKSRGIDNFSSYPQTRLMSIGIELGF